jgi:hypothetical protein
MKTLCRDRGSEWSGGTWPAAYTPPVLEKVFTKAIAEPTGLARSSDPFRHAPDNLAELQSDAAREHFSERS